MLKLINYGLVTTSTETIGFLYEATGVSVTRQINGDHTLDFNYPITGEFADAVLNGTVSAIYGSSRGGAHLCAVVCGGQIYQIMRTQLSENSISVSCTHFFNFRAKTLHYPNFGSTAEGQPDFIGTDLQEIIKHLGGRGTDLLSESAVEARGMAPLHCDIDFESVDKTNLWDILQKVIECAGQGEIYTDNGSFAIVERIGSDKGAVIHAGRNADSITIERDMSEMVTRLFPYGKDDMPISSVEPDGHGYIVSPYAPDDHNNVIDGYKEYSDIDDPEKLYYRALWEFDADNPNRIDIPAVNISGSVVALERIGHNISSLGLGDTVTVFDHGKVFSERVIAITEYPYEPELTRVSIGRVKKDMFFYLNQIGEIARRYKTIKR